MRIWRSLRRTRSIASGAAARCTACRSGVKDIIDTFDMPTEMGLPIYRGYRPATDAARVALLRRAGAIILGKTATCELAGMAPSATTNPLNAAHPPGSSSSGSAAAVADKMVPAALGTQTGGPAHRAMHARRAVY